MQAVTFLADIYTNPKYKNMLPPGVNGWTDTSNNEAWLAGTLGFTNNAYTLYAQSFATKNPVYDQTAIVAGIRRPRHRAGDRHAGLRLSRHPEGREERRTGQGDGACTSSAARHSSISPSPRSA